MKMQITPLGERHVKVVLEGRLDTPGVDSIETRFLASLVPAASNAILDMSQVDFVSSLGIRMLVSAARSLKLRQATLAMYGVQGQVHGDLRDDGAPRDDSDLPDRSGRASSRRALRLTFPGTIAGLAEAASLLRGFLDGVSLSTARRYQVELVFDEVAGNIVRHGQPATDVVVVVGLDGSDVVLTFDDDGTPFDPRTHEPQPLDTDLANSRPGGLGLGLVRKFASRFEYELTPLRHNRLTVAIPIE